MERVQIDKYTQAAARAPNRLSVFEHKPSDVHLEIGNRILNYRALCPRGGLLSSLSVMFVFALQKKRPIWCRYPKAVYFLLHPGNSLHIETMNPDARLRMFQWEAQNLLAGLRRPLVSIIFNCIHC